MPRILFAVAFMIVTVFGPMAASALGEELAWNMTRFSYLVGGQWACAKTVPHQISGDPGPGEHYVVTFKAARGNALREERIGPLDDYTFDAYFLYEPHTKKYWITMADNAGFVELLQSSNGVAYSGTGRQMNYSYSIERVYEKLSQNQLNIHETSSLNHPDETTDFTCVRQMPSP